MVIRVMPGTALVAFAASDRTGDAHAVLSDRYGLHSLCGRLMVVLTSQHWPDTQSHLSADHLWCQECAEALRNGSNDPEPQPDRRSAPSSAAS
jgi:hypothetical protein